MRKITSLLATILLACCTLAVLSFTASPASAACGDPVSKTTDRSVTVHDSEGGDNTWTFSVKVWYDRCSAVTVIRSLTYRYEFTGTDACSNWLGVDNVRINSGNIGGWNPPAVTFACQNSDHADASNVDAPSGAQITCGNDNQTGGLVDIIRHSTVWPDGQYDIPLMSIPRPTSC